MTRCERRRNVNALRVSSGARARHRFLFDFRGYGPARIRDLSMTASAPREKEKRAPRQPQGGLGARTERGSNAAVIDLEPSRPALCETISAVDRPCRVRFERDLGGLATVRAHRIKHLTRAAVVASASAASSAASVFVHSLPTVRSLVDRTGRREGRGLLKVCTRTPEPRLTGIEGQGPKLFSGLRVHRHLGSGAGQVKLKQG